MNGKKGICLHCGSEVKLVKNKARGKIGYYCTNCGRFAPLENNDNIKMAQAILEKENYTNLPSINTDNGRIHALKLVGEVPKAKLD